MNQIVVRGQEREASVPRYTHYCENCKFIGQFDQYDLYTCDHADRGGTLERTVLARYGNEAPAYKSTALYILEKQDEIRREIGGLTEKEITLLAILRVLPSIVLNVFQEG